MENPREETIARLILDQAMAAPDRVALIAPACGPLTYSQLWAAIEATAGALRALGVSSVDRVALALPDGPELAIAFLAAASAATCAPLNPASRAAELDQAFGQLDPAAVIVPAGADSTAARVAQCRGIRVLELVPQPEEGCGRFQLHGAHAFSGDRMEWKGPDETALLLQTSGTTARPKVVQLSHRRLCASARHLARFLELTPEDRCLGVMPLFHIQGLNVGLLSSLSSGGSVARTPAFEALRFFPWMDESRPTWVSAVSSIYDPILTRAPSHSAVIRRGRLRLARSGSAPLPPRLLAGLEAAFGIPVLEGYGMTEGATHITSNPPPPRVRKPGSAGVQVSGPVAIMAVNGELLPSGERGEVVVSGNGMGAPYLDDSDANAAAFRDGWFLTGDEGYLDEEGYLWITGRLKEQINRGGQKVSPVEVEAVLARHPAVSEAIVFAIPDARLGEGVAAAVVPCDGTAGEEELREYAALSLADHKVPDRIVFLDRIPTGQTGKPQRNQLADRLAAHLAATTGGSTAAGSKAPGGVMERRLCELWREVLGIGAVGPDEDFFACGGDSILAGMLLVRLRETFRVELPLRTLFDTRTPYRLAPVVERSVAGRPSSPDLERAVGDVEAELNLGEGGSAPCGTPEHA